MKILLSWLLHHLQYNKNITAEFAYNIQQLLSLHTAEIERVSHIKTQAESLSAGHVVHIFSDTIEVYSKEWQKSVILPIRENAFTGDWFLIRYDYISDQGHWAQMSDFGSTSDGLIPALGDDPDTLQSGQWKKNIAWEDFVFEIDNAAVSHRPDLWGHQGWAREVAALLSIPFLDHEYQKALPTNITEQYFSDLPSHSTTAELCAQNICMRIEKNTPCNRLVSSTITTSNAGASRIFYTIQLARIDARSKSALIDATNYVMYDTGHPMHGFDQSGISGNTITLRNAENAEQLELLDTVTIKLNDHDCIFADQSGPLSLAGVMGGARASLSTATTTIIVEAASYQASTIRQSSLRHKHRTEASTRFEKSTDPLGCDRAIGCFFSTIKNMGIAIDPSTAILILGNEKLKIRTISLSHQTIEQKIGSSIASMQVQTILNNLGFEVVQKQDEYIVTIPSFRVAKDIAIAEDIIEEIARIYGYDTIVPALPMMKMASHDISLLQNVRTIKQVAARTCGLYELYSHALYDEYFLKQIDYNPINTIDVANPISDNAKRLVTSLVPHLLKACQLNSVQNNSLGFFEVQRIWERTGSESIEREVLALTSATVGAEGSFYNGKDIVTRIFGSIDASLQWIRYDQYANQSTIPLWIQHITRELLSTNQIALLLSNDEIVGYAGMIRFDKMQKLFEGTIFVCECEYKKIIKNIKKISYTPLSKYQHVFLDISMLAPYTLTVDAIEHIISTSDNRIKDIRMVDYFTKAEWVDQRSVTLRVRVQDETKAVDKETIEEVMNAMKISVESKGALVR
jgi:phenylalanyl-tRNA synthetase beta chain